MTEHPLGNCKFCGGNKLVIQFNEYVQGRFIWVHNKDIKLIDDPRFCIECGKASIKDLFTDIEKDANPNPKPEQLLEQTKDHGNWTGEDNAIVDKYNKMKTKL